jgi:neurotransmitter:Na+ symporter, NSS family
MNEFVEIVLGSLIVIPIAAGYLGLEWVQQNASFGMAFQTMPFLFENWGPLFATLAGVFWFGLLFFAGITSSLAMGTPWMGFMQDEFGISRRKSAWSFGAVVLVLGMPTVLFYNYGVFGEYDYWAGTVSLVVFALAESILFAWIYGIDKGWEELKAGADMKVPEFYKYVTKYITPAFLACIFLGSIFLPLNRDFPAAFESLSQGNGWPLDNTSIIKQIANTAIHDQLNAATDPEEIAQLQDRLTYVNGARILLVIAFSAISFLVYLAYRKRKAAGRL